MEPRLRQHISRVASFDQNAGFQTDLSKRTGQHGVGSLGKELFRSRIMLDGFRDCSYLPESIQKVAVVIHVSNQTL